MKSLAAALFGLALAVSGPAAADDGDATGVRAVINQQIAAFRADDGAAAYAFASPRLQAIFPNPDLFMAMVRSGYRPVYRPQSVTFGRISAIPGGYAQEVFVVGPDGEVYTALYGLERQDDGSWRISSCRIVKATGESA